MTGSPPARSETAARQAGEDGRGRSEAGAAALLELGAPALFVLLWSTGFIFAKLGMPSAEPATFLALRFALVIAVMIPLARLLGARWPRRWQDRVHAIVVGLLMHVVYLGGVFAAIEKGVPAGVAALVVGLQPLVTASLAGPLLGERVRARQWVGLGLGLIGIALVLEEKLALGEGSWLGYGLNVAALLGITAGTLYQKRYSAGLDLAAGQVIQYLAAGLVCLVLALLLERREVAWTRDFVLALVWLALVLSAATWTLLMWLIRRGATAKVASLFYLVPPLAAAMGWALFGEALGWPALAGMALAAAGVALVNR